MKKKCTSLVLCLMLAGAMLLVGCGSGSESSGLSNEQMESLAGTTIEATIDSVSSTSTTFDIVYEITVDGSTGTYGETFSIDADDENYESAADFADESYGLTEGSVADLAEGDTVTITFDEYCTVSTLSIE